METKPVQTSQGIVYTHRDGQQPIQITPAGDIQMCPDDKIEQVTMSIEFDKTPSNTDRFNDLFNKYRAKKEYAQSTTVEFDSNVCKDSIQTSDQFVLKLLMNNFSQIDLMSVLSKWLLCPIQKAINDIVDQWNALASFVMHIFVPIFNQHIHTTPIGPTSPPTSTVTNFGDVPRWYKLPYVCFVEEFAYKIESAKRAQLCVQPFLNKTYTCGDMRQITKFLDKYSDNLALEIVGEHEDDPKVKAMRESGQWKKMSMYSADQANFVLLKVHDTPAQFVSPLAQELFDKLRYILQPVVNIPDDVFLFCGDFAQSMLTDISKLSEYASAVDSLCEKLLTFLKHCNYGTVTSALVQDIANESALALKKSFISQADITTFVQFIQKNQARVTDQFLQAMQYLEQQLKTGSTSYADTIQQRINEQFVVCSYTDAEQMFENIKTRSQPKTTSFTKLIEKIQVLFGVDKSIFFNTENKLTLDVLKRAARFIKAYRDMKNQLYPLNGSGAVDEDVIKQMG